MMHDSCIHKLPPLLLLLPPHRQEGYRVILLNSNPVSHAVLLGVLVCHAVLVEGVGPMHAADDGGGGACTNHTPAYATDRPCHHAVAVCGCVQ
jgi:hypothetical protein